jgi:ferrochelatase
MPEPVGVLLMAYGSPAGPDDVEAYYTHVRRGRPPAPEQLADLRRRYDAIGGVSPLREITAAQAGGLQAALDDAEPGRFRVVVGAKHAPPFVEDAVAALEAEGVGRAVGLVLAPHYSGLSVGEYVRRAREAARAVELTFVEHWHDAPGYQIGRAHV